MMSMMGGYGGYGGYSMGYHNNYYSNNQCFGGCPFNAHCEWGFCECNRGDYYTLYCNEPNLIIWDP